MATFDLWRYDSETSLSRVDAGPWRTRQATHNHRARAGLADAITIRRPEATAEPRPQLKMNFEPEPIEAEPQPKIDLQASEKNRHATKPIDADVTADQERGPDLGPVSEPKSEPIKPEPVSKRGRGRPRSSKLDNHRLEIESMFAQGHTRTEVAAHFEVSRGTLNPWMESRGIRGPEGR